MSDDLDDEWLTELKDLSKHNWHGQMVLSVPVNINEFDSWPEWLAIEVLNDFPGWDICQWHHWEGPTLFEISWSATTQEARDAVIAVLKARPAQGARHFYTTWSRSGEVIQPWHWKEV